MFPRMIAFDTETTLIAPREGIRRVGGQLKRLMPPKDGLVSAFGQVNCSPYAAPRLIVGSIYDGENGGVFQSAQFLDILEEALKDKDTHTVWHNVSFDFWVCLAARPELMRLFLTAVDQKRVHDTMFLDFLVRLARGDFDRPFPPKFVAQPSKVRSLDACAKDYLDRALCKDDRIRLGFGAYEGATLPPEFEAYALQDAIATYDVAQAILEEGRCQGMDESLFGETYQVKSSIVFAAMDRYGVGVDTEEATRLKTEYSKDLPRLRSALVDYGFGRWTPATGTSRPVMEKEEFTLDEVETFESMYPNRKWVYEDGKMVKYVFFARKRKTDTFRLVSRFEAEAKFCLRQDVIRDSLEEEIVPLLQEKPPRDSKGRLKLDKMFWQRNLPKRAKNFRTWYMYIEHVKLLSTYIDTYALTDRVFPKWRICGPRSGRTSCSSPNCQNIPKRRSSLRSLFVPTKGNVFVQADYSTQEVLTLTESIYHNLGIEGPLLQAIRDGADLHRRTASLMLNIPESEVTDEQRKMAKAYVFGIPGGLGPQKLKEYARNSYEIEMTLEEATEKRNAFLNAYWDIAAHLESCNVNMLARLKDSTGLSVEQMMEEFGVFTVKELRTALRETKNPVWKERFFDAERACRVVLPSGRVRSHCSYTEASNSHFQGLAADISKQAMWNCLLYGLKIVLAVHDEFVIECPPESAEEHANKLQQSMLLAFRQVCPTVGPYAKVEVKYPLEKWGEARNVFGELCA